MIPYSMRLCDTSYPGNVCLIFRFFGSIPAGFPSPAEDHKEGDIDLAALLQPNKDSTYVVRIKGDSMKEANIPSGCLAVVDRSIRVYHGAIIVAVVDGEFTV